MYVTFHQQRLHHQHSVKFFIWSPTRQKKKKKISSSLGRRVVHDSCLPSLVLNNYITFKFPLKISLLRHHQHHQVDLRGHNLMHFCISLISHLQLFNNGISCTFLFNDSNVERYWFIYVQKWAYITKLWTHKTYHKSRTKRWAEMDIISIW